MKFTPKTVDHSINVSKKHPLEYMFVMLSTLLIVLIIAYLSLGFIIDLTVNHMPQSWDQKMSGIFQEKVMLESAQKQGNKYFKQQEFAQALLNDLVAMSSLAGRDFKVYISDNDMINAVALPGDIIVVYRGLYEKIQSNNELAMLLGHELGHFVNRDHLRGLGRGLLMIVVAITVGASDQSIRNLAANVLTGGYLKHSRVQESKADLFGLELVNAHYGHVGGAVDLFDRLEEMGHSENFLSEYFSTHPLSDKRMRHLHSLILESDYDEKSPIPLSQEYQIKPEVEQPEV